MALIRCQKCNGEISETADKCPICGTPLIVAIQRKHKRYFIEIAIGVILIALVMLAARLVVKHWKLKASQPQTQQQIPSK